MQLYSARTAQRTRQIVGDVSAVLVLALSTWLAIEIARMIDSLARFGVQMQETGTQLAGTLRDAAEMLEGVPLIGNGLGVPFVDASTAASGLTEAGSTLEAAVHALAIGVGIAIWLVAALILVLVWLLPRLRFVRAAAVTERIAASPAGRDLLAIRALVTRPLDEVRAAAVDPLRALREGDTAVLDALAALELSAAGVRRG